MDFDALVAEVLARVLAKLADTEDAPGAAAPEAALHAESPAKPRLLILAQEHGEACHALLESPPLLERYEITCSLLQEHEVDVEEFDGVLLYGLSNEALCKLAGGSCDTPFTRLASRAILCGKKVWVPTEQVELYRYRGRAPACYFEMLHDKLELLVKSGVSICAQGNLERTLLDNGPTPPPPPPGETGACVSKAEEAKAAGRPEAGKSLCIDKRVITERDILEARKSGAAELHVSQRAILTELAKDSARARDLIIIRD